MAIHFDPAKNQSNLEKYGISLEHTEKFDFGAAFYDVDDSQDYGEVRYNAIGWLDATLHTLTFTQEGEVVRAISLRRATKQEQKKYAKQPYAAANTRYRKPRVDGEKIRRRQAL